MVKYTEQQFFNAIKQRSEEHQKAFDFALQEKLYSQMGSIIRQELDSLMRLYYYDGFKSEMEKEKILNSFYAGDKKTFASDSYMINSLNGILGWAKHIYDIGCQFIHLTQFHNWEQGEPQLSFTDEQRDEIVEAVNWWQGEYLKSDFRLCKDFTFNDLVKAAPGIFNKLRVNLFSKTERVQNGGKENGKDSN